MAINDPSARPAPGDPAPRDPAGADPGIPPGNTPYWWEDPDLAAALAEVEEFVGTGGWDASPQMFALVRTADLLIAEPALAGSLADAGTFTPIAQEVLPSGDLSEALSTISWPEEVAGCVLVQEIVVLPPAAVIEPDAEPNSRASGEKSREGNDVEITAEEAAVHPDRAEARLAAGVLRGLDGGACLLRVRGKDDATPLRGADLAPNLLRALQATFQD